MPTVLVAYDGSASAQRALEYAAALATPGGTVAVIHVVPVRGVSSRLETVTAEESARQRALLREARAALSRWHGSVVLVPALGDPLEEILTAAADLDASVIVSGRGRNTRTHPHRRLGVRLARRAACDVLLAA
jgi:nucleotide-binding universal stress UspA family protein